jgi:hypothetical protein
MNPLVFVNLAACTGADPDLFTITNPKKALPALAYCARCQVVAECEALVVPPPPAPFSWFDGIAGEKVWWKGVAIAGLSDDGEMKIVLIREAELFDESELPEV